MSSLDTIPNSSHNFCELNNYLGEILQSNCKKDGRCDRLSNDLVILRNKSCDNTLLNDLSFNKDLLSFNAKRKQRKTKKAFLF